MRRATLIGGACFAAVAAFATTAHFRTATDTADTTTGAGPRTAEASRGGAQEGDGPESGRGEGRPLRPAQRTEESKALASAEDGVVSANAEIAQSLRDEGTCDERAVGLESVIHRVGPRIRRLASLRNSMSPEEQEAYLRAFTQRHQPSVDALQSVLKGALGACGEHESFRNALQSWAELNAG